MLDFPPSLSELPPVLYKYRKFDENGWRMLSDLEVFFASPKHLNDPLDTQLPILYEQGTLKQIYNMNLERLKESSVNVTRKERKCLAKKMAQAAYRNIKDSERREALRKDIAEKTDLMVGILSLAATRNQSQMWSHYADGHRGFCIGFDTKKLFRFTDRKIYEGIPLLFNQVHYYAELPKLNPYKMTDSQVFMTKLFSKSQGWSYEREYRIISDDRPDFALRLDSDILHSITLGVKCQTEDKQKVISLMASKGYLVTLEESGFLETGELYFKPVSHSER